MSKTQIYQTMVGAVEALTPRVKAFHLELDRPLEFVAGQFVYALIERDGHVIRKPYSIASPPFQPDRIELAVTLVPGGYVSTWFHGIQGVEKLTVD